MKTTLNPFTGLPDYIEGEASVTSSELSALEARVSALSGAPGWATSTYVDGQISVASAQALSALNVVSNALSAVELRLSGVSTLASEAAT